MNWLNDMYALDADGNCDDAIDILFEALDELLLAERYENCDAILQALDVDRMSATLLVGCISFTQLAARHLPSYPAFFAAVESRLRVLAPDRVDRLLWGLR